MKVQRVIGDIRSVVNAMNLQLEYGKLLHTTLLASVLMYGSETMIRRGLVLELKR